MAVVNSENAGGFRYSKSNKENIRESKIKDDYEVTNIWKIPPSYSKKHPAIFPLALAERVIKYYSFKTDVVLDPFAGIGTVGEAAIKLGRRFVLVEVDKKYIAVMKDRAEKWLGTKASEILYINTEAPQLKEQILLL